MPANAASDKGGPSARTYGVRVLHAGMVMLAAAGCLAGVYLLLPLRAPNQIALPVLIGAITVFGVGLLVAGRAFQLRRQEVVSRLPGRRAMSGLAIPLFAAAGWLLARHITPGVFPVLTLPATVAWLVALAVLAFPFLVGERSLSAAPAGLLSEAADLTRLAKFVLLTMAAIGLTIVGQYRQAEWAALPTAMLAVLVLAALAEAFMRSLAGLLLPLAESAKPTFLAANMVATVATRPPWRLPAAGKEVLKNSFGVDLSRSWALDYARRATLPMAGGLAVVAWGLTSVQLVPTAGRAIYERFGVPLAVLQPGCHLTLPWPFGRLRPIELGVVHQLAIGSGRGESDAAQAGPFEPAAAAEAEPGVQEDRLWDVRHAREATFLIASAFGDRQSFAVLQADATIVYRIGLDDESARRAAYAVAGPAAVVQAVAGSRIVKYLAHVTLDNAIGADRIRIERDLLADIRSRLDALETGIDALGVVIEALHPPPEAAAAYHLVQAAEIAAAANVSVARSQAVMTVESAKSDALTNRANAMAAAAETLSAARADRLLFQADDLGYRANSAVFSLERYLARLKAGLTEARLLLIDSRLTGATTPLVDLRGEGARRGANDESDIITGPGEGPIPGLPK